MSGNRTHRPYALLATIGLIASVAIAVVAGPAAAAQGDLYTVAGTGTADSFGYNGYTGDGSPATTALVSAGQTVIDANGNLLFVDEDGYRVRLVAESASNPGYSIDGCVSACTWTAGDVYTIAGTGGYGYNGDGIPATAAQLRFLGSGMVLDADGNPILVDTGNERVRVIAESATNPGYPLAGCADTCTWTVGDIYTIAGNGSYVFSGDGGPATNAGFDYPSSATVDPQGNVLVNGDNSEQVRVVAVSASNPGYLLSGCGGICTWTVGDLYTIAGNGTAGYAGDGGPATSAEFFGVGAITVDAPGNLLVSDANNNRLRVVAMSATNPGYALGGCDDTCSWTVGDVYTIAGNGTIGYRGDGGPATNAELSPAEVTVDHEGDVLTADDIARVRVVAVSASNPGYALAGCDHPCTWTVGNVYTIAGNGTRDYTGDGALAVNTGLDPGPVTVAPNGNLYISANNRILDLIEVHTAPSAPVTPTALPGNGAATVAWNVPASTGGLAVTGYAVTPHLDGTALTPRTFQTVSTSQVITGLTNGKSYMFTVAAINGLGTGPTASTAAISVGAPVAPSEVRAVSNPTTSGLGSISVTYAEAANNGAAITKFTATCTPRVPRVGVTTRVAEHDGPVAAPIVVGGLPVTRNYTCTVTATNSRGKSPTSGVSSLIPVGAPGAPSGTHPVRVAAAEFKVNFSPGPNDGNKTHGYTATCISTDGGRTVRQSGPRSPLTITGLTAGATYTCTVTGTNDRGAGPPSSASATVIA